MDALRERSVLRMAMHISTILFLIVGKGCCEECDYSSDYPYCASLNSGDEMRSPECSTHQPVFSTSRPRYCTLNLENKDSYEECLGYSNCNNGMWCKAEKCGNISGMNHIFGRRRSPHLHSSCPRFQGKYFCGMNGQDGCQNSTSNSVPVVVLMHGVDTYLGTFKLQENGYSCESLRICIRRNVTKTLCSNLKKNGMCSFVLRRLATWPSGRYVEGYLYLTEPMNISSLQVYHNASELHRNISFTCCGRNFTLTNGTFQSVSFCERNITSDGSGDTLTFEKTNIGSMTNSTEDCKDGTPRASRSCKGDFITLSSWADPNETKCTDEDDNDDSTTMASEITLTGPIGDELSTVPTTDVSKARTGVTTVSTTEPTTALREDFTDDVAVTKENVNFVSRMLSENTKNPEKVDAVKLMRISERLQNISGIGDTSLEVTRHVMQIVDNLINVKEDVFKESSSGGTPVKILHALEAQLTNLHKGATNFTFVKSSLGVVTRQLERSAFLENITFGGLFSMGEEDSSEQQSNVSVMTGNFKFYSKFPATITLPKNLLDEIPTGHNNRIPVTFIIHRTNLLFMSSSTEERRHRESVESLVIAATVENQTVTNLRNPVISRFQLPHVDKQMIKTTRKCVFWDFTLANGLGEWSSEGCELVSRSEDNTGAIIECHCNHLTNFAVLLDVQGDIDHIVLDILSIIGCVVSIFALVITLIVLLAVKKLREQVPQKSIINLCFALLGLYICFLVGIDKSSLGIGCVIFGAFIHYFCLASVAWMCVVATNMYLLFVRVFNADVTGFMWKASLAAWGLPAIVVVVSVILRHQNYTSSYCFPQPGTLVFYLGVLLLIGLMLCYNIVIFILVIRQITCGRTGKRAGQDIRTEIIERAQSIIIISVLLGLTWVFGFLSIGGARFIFNLLFLVFNSLQGFFVFVFFILRPTNVRMLLFKCCYRQQEDNVGSYTVNKSKIDETNDQKDSLDMNDVVVTTTEA